MTEIAFWDSETDGLLDAATKMHSVGVISSRGNTLSGADQKGYVPIAEVLRSLEGADIRVAHNGQDFDERVTRRLYPWWDPKGTQLDTLLISRLLFPVISKSGPNTHKVEPKLRTRHSLEAWGQRLGEPKDDYSHRKEAAFKAKYPEATPEEVIRHVWGTWDPEMSEYMMQDIKTLKRLFQYLMAQKPPQEAVKLEHDFASIIRRQECWGFTFDMTKALVLQADLNEKSAQLETDLITNFGSWWEPGKLTKAAATREVKLPEFPDVTVPRYGAKGNLLAPYVGPPKCTFFAGAPYTPIKRTQFQPSSREHVRKMLYQRYRWKPTKFTDKGTPQIDDDVLRALPYPEAQALADYFQVDKLAGYVSKGKNAWLKTAVQEGSQTWRQHGRVNTIGTYTFRCSHSNPNTAQIPSRDPYYGHLCRELFKARSGFRLVGFDGSGMQLRLLAHYLARWDGGTYAGVFERGEDAHAFMRDSIGTDLMGEGPEGRSRGKTLNYALTFGGGERKLGSIIQPHAKDADKVALGKTVKERMLPVFGTAFDDLKLALKTRVEDHGFLLGLDGRKARVPKPHAALATLLQMGEAVVMRKALVLDDNELQRRGLTPGVDAAGRCHPDRADYEFCANVHDEAQADVRPECVDVFTEVALWAVPEAGRAFKLKCPLASDVKVGDNWSSTH
jgi:DNA polymerase-1